MQISPKEGEARTFHFQRLEISGGGEALISITWSDDGVNLQLNGTKLKGFAEASDDIFKLNTKERAPVSLTLHKPKFTAGLSEDERFIFETIRDVQVKVAIATRYDLIRASGITLTGLQPLVDAIETASGDSSRG